MLTYQPIVFGFYKCRQPARSNPAPSNPAPLTPPLSNPTHHLRARGCCKSCWPSPRKDTECT